MGQLPDQSHNSASAVRQLAHRVRTRPQVAVRGLLLFGAVLALAWYLWLATTQWFVLDEFQYLGPEPGRNYLKWLLQPHNEHVIVTTKLWFSSVVRVIGLNHYAIFAIPMVVGHIWSSTAAYWLARRGTGQRMLGLFAFFIVLFLGGAIGTLTWAGQMQFTWSVAAGLTVLCLAVADGRRVAVSVAAAAIVGAITGSAYVVFGAIAAVVLLRRRRYWAALGAVAPPMLILAVEKLIWNPPTPYAATSLADIAIDGPPFAVGVVETAVAATVHISGLGAVVLLALTVATAVVASYPDNKLKDSVSALIALSLAGVVFASLALIVLGRVNLGPDAATGGGYSYLILMPMVPLVFVLIAQALGRSARSLLVLGAVTAWLVVTGLVQGQQTAAGLSSWKWQGEERLASAAALAVEAAPTFPDSLPAPSTSPTVTQAVVADFVGRGWLTADPGPPEVRADVTLATQLRVANAPAQSCRAKAPTRVLPQQTVAVGADAAAKVEARLTAVAALRVVPLQPGQRVTVQSLADEAVLLTATGGPLLGCDPIAP